MGQSTGDGRFDRETFLGGLLIFFGGGYITQYISLQHAADNRERSPDPRCPGQTSVLFMFRQPVDHMWSMLLYVMCLLHVYVCYMLFYVMSVIGYMSVICLVLRLS